MRRGRKKFLVQLGLYILSFCNIDHWQRHANQQGFCKIRFNNGVTNILENVPPQQANGLGKRFHRHLKDPPGGTHLPWGEIQPSSSLCIWISFKEWIRTAPNQRVFDFAPCPSGEMVAPLWLMHLPYDYYAKRFPRHIQLPHANPSVFNNLLGASPSVLTVSNHRSNHALHDKML